ncbi:hypothetical protein [Nitrosopumilus sp.]|uniref:hypothetical protein n=1 Tax=Nitrosopumilus sp. TaxID=2024843 RepID=UPI00292D0757|nr:hypothetical protein [Nitrosopumilus sp.]
MTPIDTDSCQVGEDMHFSRDGEKYFLTCMGSDNVIIFDGNTDKKIDEISSKKEQNLQFSSEEIENSLIQIIKNTK